MKILIIDEEEQLRSSFAKTLGNLGHEAIEVDSVELGLGRLAKEAYRVVFLGLHEINDETSSSIERLNDSFYHLDVVVFSPSPSVAEAVEAMQSGASDFIPIPFSVKRIERVLERLDVTRKTSDRLAELEELLVSNAPPVNFESNDTSMAPVLEMAAKVAPTNTTVLILGESGTGKTLMARGLHEASERGDQPFITISCPSLSRELLESELFGHVKGAFTGAITDKFGKVAAAEGGTLFLDEIGELPAELQPKLLRLLQEQEYERVGDTVTRKTDVRIVAATNRDLSQAVDEGSFREDLFYRLNVFTLEVPPLRERPADLHRIAQDNLLFYAKQIGKPLQGFHPGAVDAMNRYTWPGNLRELDNAVERAVILADGEFVELANLPGDLRDEEKASFGADLPLGAPVTLEELEKAHMRHVLASAATAEKAARILGINKSTLYRKRKRYSI